MGQPIIEMYFGTHEYTVHNNTFEFNYGVIIGLDKIEYVNLFMHSNGKKTIKILNGDFNVYYVSEFSDRSNVIMRNV